MSRVVVAAAMRWSSCAGHVQLVAGALRHPHKCLRRSKRRDGPELMKTPSRAAVASPTIDAMVGALAEEVQAIKKKGGNYQVALTAGEFVKREGESWIYRFMVRGEHHLRDDAAVSLRLPGEEASGYIVSFQNGVLLVALARDVGPGIPSAKLVIDDSFLVARLRERLLEVAAGKVPFQLKSAERVVAGTCSMLTKEEPHARVFMDGRLNEEQREAVRRALGSELCYLWGPPGTGKTTTLARLVEAHVRAGRSVLLVANTNVAVDTALAKVCEQMAGEGMFEQGQVLRWGPIVMDQLRSDFGTKVDLEQVCIRIGKALAEERDKLEGEVRVDRDRVSELQAAIDLDLAIATTEEECRSRLAAAAQIEKDQQERVAQVATLKDRISEAREKLGRASQMGAVRRWFSGLHPKALQGVIDKAQTQTVLIEGAIGEGERKLAEHRAAAIAKAGEIGQLRARVRISLSLAMLRSTLATATTLIKQKEARLVELRQQLDGIREAVLKNCRVLATTVYRTYAGPALPRLFDVVVIDEASMLMLPLAFYAAGLATGKVTVAGDFRQLPPIVQAESGHAEQWLKRDVFAAAGIPDALSKGVGHPGLVALSEQFRMHPEICDVINGLFYSDHPLRTAAARCVQPSESPELLRGAGPLHFVDTGTFGAWATHPAGKFTRYNLLQALLVRNLVVEMARTGYMPKEPGDNAQVGVVAPYAAQTSLIGRLLEGTLGRQASGVASTVHRFQGNERSVVIFDLTDATGVTLGKFLKATSIDEDGGRLMNVALSRAKDHLVVVGDLRFLLSKATQGSYLSRLLLLLQKKGHALDVARLLPLGHEAWVDGLVAAGQLLKDLPPDAAGVFNESSFYAAFPQDLARARTSVVLFSPFVTVSGVGRWVDQLRAAVARGVAVRVLCKPPGEFGGGSTEDVAAVLQRLREGGIAVDLRAKMHEKIAILDGDILWHGSLNVLSHRNTTESMLRIRAPGVCQELAKLITGRGGELGEPNLERRENPGCPQCGAPTVRMYGKYGPWFECSQGCGGKTNGPAGGAGTRQRGARRSNTSESGACPVSGCGGKLRAREGRFGPFLGCSNYPRCRYTRDLGEVTEVQDDAGDDDR